MRARSSSANVPTLMLSKVECAVVCVTVCIAVCVALGVAVCVSMCVAVCDTVGKNVVGKCADDDVLSNFTSV